MDAALVNDVASSAAWALAPLLSGAAGELEAVGGEVGASAVHQLWDLVKGYRRVERVAQDYTDRYFREDLETELRRLLRDNAHLVAHVADLLAAAEPAGMPVSGHALVQRVRAGGDILAEGETATVQDASTTGGITARAKGTSPKS
jgi:hypothetical protein